MTDDVGRLDLEFQPVFPSFDLDNSFCKALVSDGDLEGNSHEICIVELYSRAFVPVIPEDFEACCL